MKHSVLTLRTRCHTTGSTTRYPPLVQTTVMWHVKRWSVAASSIQTCWAMTGRQVAFEAPGFQHHFSTVSFSSLCINQWIVAHYPFSQLCRMHWQYQTMLLKKGRLSWNAKLDASCTRLQKQDAWAKMWTWTRGVHLPRFGTRMNKRRQDNVFHIAFLLRAPLVATCT